MLNEPLNAYQRLKVLIDKTLILVGIADLIKKNTY